MTGPIETRGTDVVLDYVTTESGEPFELPDGAEVVRLELSPLTGEHQVWYLVATTKS